MKTCRNPWLNLFLTLLVPLGLLGSACQKGGAGSAKRLSGAGATFPYPLYAQWAHQYQRVTGVQVNYQSIGSGGGLAQIKAKTVDFGASDEPLHKKDLDAAGLIQFPTVMGGVVPVLNVPGVGAGRLRLPPAALAGIFLGTIKKWNDAALTTANPGLRLPDLDINVVHRADGSGTTWIFTDYLSKISPAWKQKVGTGKAVSWPVGLGGKGNEGVAAYVQRLRGTIGYVEYAYALVNKIPHAQLQNRSGNFVEPTMETFQAAAANADWAKAPGFHMVLTDQPGDRSWPITGATFILMQREQARGDKAKAILEFFAWCYEKGDEVAKRLHYVPLPKEVIPMVKAHWRKELSAGGKPVWK